MATAKKAVPAKVVEIDPNAKPVDAVVVADRRNTLGRRLGVLALVLLVLFFSINGYIQAAKSNSKAKDAEKERTALIHSVRGFSKTLKRQTDLIEKLQAALRAQNFILKENGIETVVIPGESPSQGPQSNPQKPPNNPKPGHPNGPKKHQNKPHHHGNGKPPHDPPPNDHGPVSDVEKRVCSLTGICLQAIRSVNVSDQEQQSVRHPKVYCPSWSTGFWGTIFCVVANLGIV